MMPKIPKIVKKPCPKRDYSELELLREPRSIQQIRCICGCLHKRTIFSARPLSTPHPTVTPMSNLPHPPLFPTRIRVDTLSRPPTTAAQCSR